MSGAGSSSGRPGGPPANRFAPGTSGNPKGRPKGKKNKRTIVRRVAQETHVVSIGGQSRRLSNAELLFVVLQNKALDGDRRAAQLLDKYRDRFSSSEKQYPGCGVLVAPEQYTAET